MKTLILCLLLLTTVIFAQTKEDLVKNIDELKKSGNNPVVVFEIDDVLLDKSQRINKIIEQWFAKNAPKTVESLKTLPNLTIENFKEQLISIKFKDEKKLTELQTFIDTSIANGDICQYDIAKEKSVEYISNLHKKGVLIVYLSQRDINTLPQSVSSLKKEGFPIGEANTMIILKNSADSTFAFKKSSLAKIINYGELVAIFENDTELNNKLNLTFKNIMFLKGF